MNDLLSQHLDVEGRSGHDVIPALDNFRFDYLFSIHGTKPLVFHKRVHQDAVPEFISRKP
jgi:hypothetical protein